MISWREILDEIKTSINKLVQAAATDSSSIEIDTSSPNVAV